MIAELELQSQKKKVKLIIAAIVTAVLLPLILITAFTAMVRADGSGSPDACLDTTTNVLGSQEGTPNEVTVDVGTGNVATGVCIKSGERMFEGVTHSDVLGNGTYDGDPVAHNDFPVIDDCYVVAGVGTQEVTVTRSEDSPRCQGISHIDVVFQQSQEPELSGSLLVNKVLLNAAGAVTGGNTEANTLGFRWDFHGNPLNNLMGSTVDELDADDYLVTENSVEGYTFIGYYLGREGSCSETEEDKTLPVTVTVEEEETAIVTFCNQAEAEEENGGGGGGQVLGTTTQVVAPAGGVSAGAGGAAGSITNSLFGLGSSLTALGYGVASLRKKQ